MVTVVCDVDWGGSDNEKAELAKTTRMLWWGREVGNANVINPCVTDGFILFNLILRYKYFIL